MPTRTPLQYGELGTPFLWPQSFTLVPRWMTSTADSLKISTYFTRTYDSELDWEDKVVEPKEMALWPCDVYIGEQVLGDLVLVPRRSAHQVLNRGGLTVKMSWSRMTSQGIIEGVRLELPTYHRYASFPLCTSAVSVKRGF